MKSYRDIEGDGGSRIAEQVGEREARIEQNLGSVRHLLAIGSGKGGVGKSTLVALLAAALQERNLRVAVLDADVNGPSQARLAGLRPTPLVPDANGRLALPRAASGLGVVSLGALVPETEAVGFGDSHIWRASREFTFLAELLASLSWGDLDFLLVDLPPGADRTHHHAEFLGQRASFVLVTIPSDLSRGVVSRSVAALRAAEARVLGYVENMAGYWCSGCGELRPLFPSEEEVSLDLPRLGRVPFDPALAAACDRGIAAPAGPVRKAIEELTARIVAAVEKEP